MSAVTSKQSDITLDGGGGTSKQRKATEQKEQQRYTATAAAAAVTTAKQHQRYLGSRLGYPNPRHQSLTKRRSGALPSNMHQTKGEKLDNHKRKGNEILFWSNSTLESISIVLLSHTLNT